MMTVRLLPMWLMALSLSAFLPIRSAAQDTSQTGILADIAILEDQRAIDTARVQQWTLNSDPEIRARTAYMIGIVGDTAYRASLAKLLDDDAKVVRLEAIFAAGQVADSSYMPWLLRYSADGDSAVKSRAIEALSKVGNESSARQLIAILADSLEKPHFRALAAESVHRLRDALSFGALVAQAANPDVTIREKVFFALARRANAQALPFYVKGVKDSSRQIRIYSLNALSRVGDRSVLADIAPLLQEDDWRVKYYSLGVLDKVRASESVLQVVSLLNSKEHVYVRRAAIRVLGDLGDTSATKYLFPLLGDKDINLANEALSSIVRLLKERAEPYITPFATSSDARKRQGAAEASENLKSTNEWDIPGKLAEDRVPSVRAAACQALLQWEQQKVRTDYLAKAVADSDLVPVVLACDQIASGHLYRYVPDLSSAYERAVAADNDDIKAAILGTFAEFGDSLTHSAQLDSIVAGALRDENRSVRLLAERVATMLGLPFTPSDLRYVTDITPETYSAVYAPSSTNPVAEIKTIKGTIRIVLLRSAAPKTVANFIKLAKSGYYDNRVWHRVVPDFVIQDGCSRGDGWGGPGYEIRCEYNDLPYNTGSVGMATSGKDTGGSQYFICQSAQPHLNGRYTLFGNVIQGMDVVEKIEVGDRIKSVKIIELKE